MTIIRTEIGCGVDADGNREMITYYSVYDADLAPTEAEKEEIREQIREKLRLYGDDITTCYITQNRDGVTFGVEVVVSDYLDED